LKGFLKYEIDGILQAEATGEEGATCKAHRLGSKRDRSSK